MSGYGRGPRRIGLFSHALELSPPEFSGAEPTCLLSELSLLCLGLGCSLVCCTLSEVRSDKCLRTWDTLDTFTA